jgi:2-polyprenyl-3-methyl-5-hydroxy-6-metoxy-1,4-benzoquinol methylase
MSEEHSGRRDLVAHYEAAYQTTPPWDIGEPQPAFANLAADGRLRGRVLDVGCGTGEHVLMAAAAGCEATGIDITSTAIRLAEAKARECGVSAHFIWRCRNLRRRGQFGWCSTGNAGVRR